MIIDFRVRPPTKSFLNLSIYTQPDWVEGFFKGNALSGQALISARFSLRSAVRPHQPQKKFQVTLSRRARRHPLPDS